MRIFDVVMKITCFQSIQPENRFRYGGSDLYFNCDKRRQMSQAASSPTLFHAECDSTFKCGYLVLCSAYHRSAVMIAAGPPSG
jgi:hypothetical protein